MKNNFNYDKLTPMLKHYVDVKNDFKDSILLYRVGDFYETFFDDGYIKGYTTNYIRVKREYNPNLSFF